jgi:putative PIN family toxin of toxin-antitoxin system
LKVVLDTNVYISALLFGGKCEEILKLASQGLFEVTISKKIVSEIKSVLGKKFCWNDKQIAEAIKYIKEIAFFVTPEISLAIVKDDYEDNKIIECAIASKATYIVTGDKHLLFIKEYGGTKIVSLIEFLRL